MAHPRDLAARSRPDRARRRRPAARARRGRDHRLPRPGRSGAAARPGSPARLPASGEADRAQQTIDVFAIGVGMPTPRLRIVDADAPNGFGAGVRAGARCVSPRARSPSRTTSSARSARIASLRWRTGRCRSRARPPISSLVADVCTKVIWGVAAFFLVSSIIGVPADVVAMTTLAIVLLVAATKPLLAIADRAIRRLLHSAARLADLDTVRVTNQPSALAGLLLDAAADEQTVASRWQIAHMWFDPDTRRPPRGHGLPREFIEDGPDVMQPNRNVARQSLIDRARGRRGPLRRRRQAGRSPGEVWRVRSASRISGRARTRPIRRARSRASRRGAGGSARLGCCRDP